MLVHGSDLHAEIWSAQLGHQSVWDRRKKCLFLMTCLSSHSLNKDTSGQIVDRSECYNCIKLTLIKHPCNQCGKGDINRTDLKGDKGKLLTTKG